MRALAAALAVLILALIAAGVYAAVFQPNGWQAAPPPCAPARAVTPATARVVAAAAMGPCDDPKPSHTEPP